MTYMSKVRLGRLGSKRGLHVTFPVPAVLWLLAFGLALGPLGARAAFMNEVEANDSRATATPIPDAAFDFTPEGGLAFRNSTNDPALPRFRTVELLGRNTTISDVDYFSFTGSAGEKFYFDADNDNAILCPPAISMGP